MKRFLTHQSLASPRACSSRNPNTLDPCHFCFVLCVLFFTLACVFAIIALCTFSWSSPGRPIEQQQHCQPAATRHHHIATRHHLHMRGSPSPACMLLPAVPSHLNALYVASCVVVGAAGPLSLVGSNTQLNCCRRLPTMHRMCLPACLCRVCFENTSFQCAASTQQQPCSSTAATQPAARQRQQQGNSAHSPAQQPWQQQHAALTAAPAAAAGSNTCG
jgi:hypothetical protein